MNQPWGLTGPEFTNLYIVGYLAAVVVVFVVQALVTRTGARPADTTTPLDVYQAAYLTGGPGRVVQTAIAGLALRQQILVARRGRLTEVHGARPNGPVEAAVCQELALVGTASQTSVVSRLRHHPSVAAVADQVRSRGLLIAPSGAMVWRLVLFVPAVVWCVGLVRAVNGANLGRPIGNLQILLLASGVATLILLLRRWPAARHRSSIAGRAAVRPLRQRHRGAPGWDLDAQLAGVAVVGFSALADPALRSALITSSGSGGSDGGTGCGGGGGGGGGGCGG
ncbi:MAG TPA: TIGR04222 domain-containing membrane protein [Pseudonocardiaceae bacterium]|jgi:uncharacterized protein (TIGR04222 family)|nr:TIGR04222 domain-containing membrane protein [Pseudonocardiaceae bacterium]